VADERPHPTKVRLASARVYDPIVQGEAGVDLYGVFLKDYARSSW
jgi:hypothetical protein